MSFCSRVTWLVCTVQVQKLCISSWVEQWPLQLGKTCIAICQWLSHWGEFHSVFRHYTQDRYENCSQYWSTCSSAAALGYPDLVVLAKYLLQELEPLLKDPPDKGKKQASGKDSHLHRNALDLRPTLPYLLTLAEVSGFVPDSGEWTKESNIKYWKIKSFRFSL